MERRNAPRIKCREKVAIVRANGTKIDGEIQNLGTGGLALRAHSNFYSGESVLLVWDLAWPDTSNPTRLEAVCRVNHVVLLTHPADTYVIGLNFAKVDKPVMERILEYIEHIHEAGAGAA